VFGGMKGITYTQVAQYVVLIIAYTIPAIFISIALTGSVLPQLGLIGTYAPSGGDVAFLAKLDEVVMELGFTQYTANTTNTLNMVLFTMSLMIGTAGLPHVIIRFFTVPKVADARSSAGWALVFIALLYTVAPAVGSMARLNLTTTFWPAAVTGNAFDGEAMVYDERPDWMATWQQTGLLKFSPDYTTGNAADRERAMTAIVTALTAHEAAILHLTNATEATTVMAEGRDAEELAGVLTALSSEGGFKPTFLDRNGDGRLQYYVANDTTAAIAEERGWAGNEVHAIDNDMMVLANPEIAALPGWVIALVAAGGLAAALSTAAGLLLAISSAISHDLIKSSINPNISEKGELLAARISMTGAILVAVYLGLNPPGFAAQVVALAFGLAAATIFPVLMMGIFSKRINKEGAIVGMLVGLIFTSVYIFLYLGWFFIPETNMFPNTPEYHLFGISPLSIGTVGAVLNFGSAYVVSMMTKAPPQEVTELVESIRVPRGAGAAQAH
jgi:cation/acetate symporter